MSSTVENINSNIIRRMRSVETILNIYREYELGEYDNHVTDIIGELMDVKSSYECGSIDILRMYGDLNDVYKKSAETLTNTFDSRNNLKFVDGKIISKQIGHILSNQVDGSLSNNLPELSNLQSNLQSNQVSSQLPNQRLNPEVQTQQLNLEVLPTEDSDVHMSTEEPKPQPVDELCELISETIRNLDLSQIFPKSENVVVEITPVVLGTIDSKGSNLDLTKQLNKNLANTQRQQIYTKYMKFLEKENVLNTIKRIYLFCVKMHNKFKLSNDDLNTAFNNYDNSPIDINYIEKDNNICTKCGIPLVIESKTSEYTCKKCGHSRKMFGVVFEDEQFFYQEGQRTKHGKYNPEKHCKFWVDRIQAKENTDIADKVIKSVKQCLKRDKIRIEQLTCEIIRAYLKELRLTNYNDHVPLIRKIITGKEPAQLTDHELKLLYLYFGISIQVFNRIKTPDKPNCPYHPFFIYKIIEQILTKPEDQKRKAEILSNIHLQSRDTLITNDLIWESIIEYIPEFKYKSTEI